jgi:2-oxoglutarate dehydrogenase E2 component (dihydrolipoamide succinyltransferase)
MARKEIVMPQMGESITTGTITKWHKNVGDTVDCDEVLFEISTDKVESEIPSAFEGKIVEILFAEGETVPVETVVAYLDDDLNAAVTSSSTKSTPAVEEKSNNSEEIITSAQALNEDNELINTTRFYTPLVKKLAKENNIPLGELENLKGTGLAGRVNKEDFFNFLKNRSDKTASAPAPASNITKASALASREINLNFDSSGVQVLPMDNMRKAIAKNMVLSKQVSPHVNSIDEIDMTNLVKFREGFKDEFFKQEGFKLTYTHFIIYALIQALKEHPKVNASIDGDNIILKKDINIGCAVAVPGNGLIVPIIHNADNLNLLGLCRQVDKLAKKAKAKKLSMDDLSGGTYTFTNVGSFGTLFATPIILQPQLGIFASGAITKRVMVGKDDSIAIRSMMYGTHTYDHRVIDGELGGLFLKSVTHHLENMDAKSLL